jgi:hypothetical protein
MFSLHVKEKLAPSPGAMPGCRLDHARRISGTVDPGPD